MNMLIYSFKFSKYIKKGNVFNVSWINYYEVVICVDLKPYMGSNAISFHESSTTDV